MDQVIRVISEETGATSAEYAIMVGLIIVVIAAAVQSIGTSLIPGFTTMSVAVGS